MELFPDSIFAHRYLSPTSSLAVWIELIGHHECCGLARGLAILGLDKLLEGFRNDVQYAGRSDQSRGLHKIAPKDLGRQDFVNFEGSV
jgi:hypothetical protein